MRGISSAQFARQRRDGKDKEHEAGTGSATVSPSRFAEMEASVADLAGLLRNSLARDPQTLGPSGPPQCVVQRAQLGLRQLAFLLREPYQLRHLPRLSVSPSIVCAFPTARAAREHNLCNPPWGLIDDLVIKLHTSGAAATVIMTCWPDWSWRQCLSEMASEVVIFLPSPKLFASGRLGVRGGVGPPKWPVVAF
eukprot:jgi/Tetstr1/453796/TSEL_040748.t1